MQKTRWKGKFRGCLEFINIWKGQEDKDLCNKESPIDLIINLDWEGGLNTQLLTSVRKYGGVYACEQRQRFSFFPLGQTRH